MPAKKKIADRAHQLAVDARKMADDTRERMQALADEAADLRAADTVPTAGEVPLLDGVRRVADWQSDLNRALDAVVATAAELERAAVPFTTAAEPAPSVRGRTPPAGRTSPRSRAEPA